MNAREPEAYRADRGSSVTFIGMLGAVFYGVAVGGTLVWLIMR